MKFLHVSELTATLKEWNC